MAAHSFKHHPSQNHDTFAKRIITWQKQSGRQHLPWQVNDPYKVWLSEIMLQQTQVSTVIPYFQRFTQAYPTVKSLAQAPIDDVMAMWAGLGYYTRARNLHKCAQEVVQNWAEQFPQEVQDLQSLPGIGRSTASAIAAFAYGKRAAILDGNVKRVLARYLAIDEPINQKKVEDTLWHYAESLLPQTCSKITAHMRAYTQGMMDLGAMVCTRSRPQCSICPLQTDCLALAQQRTQELPIKKKLGHQIKKQEKYADVLIVIHNGAVLMQQRPPTGIWGGLLSLPEINGMQALAHYEAVTQASLKNWIRAWAKSETQTMKTYEKLEKINHGFTHFTLWMQPHYMEVAQLQNAVHEPNAVWLKFSQIAQAALPAPIKRLLLDCLSVKEYER